MYYCRCTEIATLEHFILLLVLEWPLLAEILANYFTHETKHSLTPTHPLNTLLYSLK